MPRIARSAIGGTCYHLINRGNGRNDVFLNDFDYEAFIKCLAQACLEHPMPVYGYCLLPNHFHLVVQPVADGDLSTWMHWLQNTHVRRYHQHHKTSGHLWQGRFKSFPIEEGEPLLSVLRYIEGNPVRANLVRSAERWPWSSAQAWVQPGSRPSWLTEGPLKRGVNWLALVNEPPPASEAAALKNSITRGAPYGSERWVRLTAKNHHLESTLRPRGRPRKDGV